MKIILRKSFGEIQIETADDKDAIMQASFWSELPDLCPICGETLYLHYRETKDEYKYFELHCRGEEPHRTQFGQYKHGGLFYKRDWGVASFLSPTAADREEFDREQEKRDAEWKSERPIAAPDRFADDTQVQVAYEAIRSVLGEPWRSKPDETRDQYLARLRRQYQGLVGEKRS